MKRFNLSFCLLLVFLFDLSAIAAEPKTKATQVTVDKVKITEQASKAIEPVKTQLQSLQQTITTTTSTSKTGPVVNSSITKGSLMTVNEKKDTVVLMETEKGPIKIKLFMDEAPITAGNFKDLVERGFYNGIGFHRIIRGFVVQGGCPLGNGTGGFTDPETKQQRTIKHEKTNLRHDRAGIVAMARTANPDSASSQFFIDLAPLPSLDPGGVDPYGYAIFGEVIEGMDVVNKIVNENVPPFPGSDGTTNMVKIKKATVL